MNGEPLEWELQLISKDPETRKLIFDIMYQKNEIELYAKSYEKADEYLKDYKDYTNNNFFNLNNYSESEREKARYKKKQNNEKKLEKLFKEEEKRWEKREEEKERERIKESIYEEDLAKRKKRLLDKDLNYNSDEEKQKYKKNSKYFEERNKLRNKERQSDEIMRKKENPYNEPISCNSNVYDLVPLNNNHNQLELYHNSPEKEAKTKVFVHEITDDEDDMETAVNPNGTKIQVDFNFHKLQIGNREIDLDDNEHDLYTQSKDLLEKFEIDEATKTKIEEINNELKSKKEREDKKKNTETSKTVLKNTNLQYKNSDLKLLEIQKQIYEMIPKTKEELFGFNINWTSVAKVITNLNSSTTSWTINSNRG